MNDVNTVCRKRVRLELFDLHDLQVRLPNIYVFVYILSVEWQCATRMTMCTLILIHSIGLRSCAQRTSWHCSTTEHATYCVTSLLNTLHLSNDFSVPEW